MKTIKIIILFFYFSSAFSQHSKVCVEYNMIINREENFLKGEHLGSYFQYAMDNASRFRFHLIVDENISLFKKQEILNLDNEKHKINITLALGGYLGEIYQFKDYWMSEAGFGAKNAYIKKEPKKNWVLHNETKEIDGFLCYKATNIDIVIGLEGKIWEHPVTAWYCPKIPVQFGPLGYGGLPGLILELQVRYTIYGAQSIVFNCPEKIEKPANAKIISQDEYKKLMENPIGE